MMNRPPLQQAALIVFAILSFVVPAFAQPPDTSWTRVWDYADDDEYLECVRALEDGGFIAGGWTFEPGIGYQSWTARLNPTGESIWEQLEGDGLSEGTHYIEPTSDGGFIHCGEDQVASFPQINFQAFIRKLDADGNEEWVRAWDTPGGWQDYYLCVREVAAGGYVAVGVRGEQYVISRLGPNGGDIWHRFTNDLHDPPEWVEPMSDGGFIVPGRQWNEGANTWVFTLYKLDQNGLVEWINQEAMPGVLETGKAMCVREAEDGVFYACGFVSINPDNFRQRFYVTKRNEDGGIIWYLLIEQNHWEEALEMDIMGDGNLAVVGRSLLFNVGYEEWLVKVSSDGDVLWQYEDTYGDMVSVDQARDGGIVASILPYDDLFGYPLDLELIKFTPEVQVDLTPQTVTVPAEGGMIRYTGAVSNMLLDPTPQRVWASVITPAGQEIPLQVVPVTLQPGGSFTSGQIQIYIPGWAPPGEYRYCLHIGGRYGDPLRNMGYDEFTFVKEGDATENGGLTPSVVGSVPGFPGNESRTPQNRGQTRTPTASVPRFAVPDSPGNTQWKVFLDRARPGSDRADAVPDQDQTRPLKARVGTDISNDDSMMWPIRWITHPDSIPPNPRPFEMFRVRR